MEHPKEKVNEKSAQRELRDALSSSNAIRDPAWFEGTGESRMTLGDRGTRSATKKRRRRKRYRLLSYVVARVFANYLERLVDSNWTLR